MLQSAQSATHEPISKAFTAAILITRSITRAETAILQGIRSAPAEEILQATVAAAIDSRYRYLGELSEELDEAASLLPRELQNVLHLPPRLRHCFVLRMLMAMTRDCCARLLGLEACEIDRDTSLAAQELALTATY